jgi:hypothetical protein
MYIDKNIYINNLISFKRDNSSFKTNEDFKKYLLLQLYQYNQSHVISFIQTEMPDVLVGDNDDLDEFTSNYIHSNPFEFKIKSLISYNRKLLIKLLGFKLKRQCRITKFLLNFIKYKVNRTFDQIDFTLSNLLLVSKLILNVKYSFNLLQSGFVYVNGVKIVKPTFNLHVGDKIQIIISESFYNYYFYQFNEFLKVTLRYHNKFFKNEMTNFSTVFKKNDTTVITILNSFKQGVPRYLEVDFLTLSSIVIYKPTDFVFVNNYTHHIYNFYLSRLYNWKFLS